MAKQTGQITVLKNNKVTNVEHQIRFIFTKNNGERITRDTTSKGVINFDIPSGDWNVSWFAVDGDQKVLPLRAGLQLKITSSTPPTALADWIYGDNTHVADPILTQWTMVLDEMKYVRDSFKNETQYDGYGLFVKQSSTKKNSLMNGGRYYPLSDTVPALNAGDHGLAGANGFLESNSGLDFAGLAGGFVHYYVQANYQNNKDRLVAFFNGYTTNDLYISVKNSGVWSRPAKFYSTDNTTVDSNGFIKAASPIIKLFDDRIETNDSFKEEPIFEKISAGVYRISNTIGLAKEGWTYNVPKDGNDKPYFHVIVQKTLDGAIISVHDQFETRKKKKIKDIYGDEQTVEVVEYILSEARDIKPHERWIDLRFHEEEIVPGELEKEIT